MSKQVVVDILEMLNPEYEACIEKKSILFGSGFHVYEYKKSKYYLERAFDP